MAEKSERMGKRGGEWMNEFVVGMHGCTSREVQEGVGGIDEHM